MSFADRIRHCNSFDRSRVIPLWAGEHRIGWLRLDNAEALRSHDCVFAIQADSARLLAGGNCEEVSRAVDGVVDTLVKERRYRRIGDDYFLWIGKRAANKQTAPGKLDNMVAGGIGNGHGAAATLVKEAEEEAAVSAKLIERAVAAGALTYRMETRHGIRDDVMFVYDLEVPDDFTPSNGDGEIAGFELMPLADVLERIRTTADFKFNVNLVILDFAVRHGVLRPEDPEYLDIANGLHRPFD
jgi:8-oxo-dGTP pyrophosphatase MutT (NUDIX family)